MTTTVSSAVAKKDESPTAVVAMYTSDFATVLPTNFKAETFVRLAQGALRQNKKLMEAARANPGSLLVALLEAARLGHEPATPDFYLRPLGGKTGLSVQGLEGYRGVIKRMFNSGTVESIVAEAVYGSDHFEWNPAYMKVPSHKPGEKQTWFSDRGDCIGAYAYAIFKGGAVSKVVIVGQTRIARAMSASDSADSSYSPWKRDYEKMVIKTALHDLEPYVPKSAEAQIHDRQATAAASVVTAEHPELAAAEGERIDPETGEVYSDEPVDAEVVEDWPPVAQPGPGPGPKP